MSMKNFDELVKTTDNGEIRAYDTELLPENLKSKGNAHQPFVICGDGSISMNGLCSNGKTKLQVCQEFINGLPNHAAVKALSEVERGTIDMMVMSFSGDDVYVNSPWTPLSLFEGVTLTTGSTTPFYKALVNGIQATRVMRKHYSEQALGCKRPQIFVYTDGLATDREANYAEAKRLCEEYAGVGGKVKITVILITGEMSEDQINRVTADILSLSDNITVLRVDETKDGLPEAFEFLTSSIVVGASSSVGAEMEVLYGPGVKVAGNTETKDGKAKMGEQIIWQD